MDHLLDMVEAPTGKDIADFLDQGDDTELVALAEIHAPMVATLVEAYTRGVGFMDGGFMTRAMSAVVTAATARQVLNPSGVVREQVGDFSVLPFQGFTVAELVVLNRYRRRAQ